MNVGDIVACNVRAERGRRRWRQADLAARMATSQSTVCALELGRRRVDVEDLVRLCAALDVPLARLLDGATAEQLRTLGLATP